MPKCFQHWRSNHSFCLRLDIAVRASGQMCSRRVCPVPIVLGTRRPSGPYLPRGSGPALVAQKSPLHQVCGNCHIPPLDPCARHAPGCAARLATRLRQRSPHPVAAGSEGGGDGGLDHLHRLLRRFQLDRPGTESADRPFPRLPAEHKRAGGIAVPMPITRSHAGIVKRCLPRDRDVRSGRPEALVDALAVTRAAPVGAVLDSVLAAGPQASRACR